MPTIPDRVFDLVAQQTGVKRARLTSDTRLDADLQIGGDDVDELFDAFAKEFKVDVSELAPRFEEYFYPEVSAGGRGVTLVTAIAIVPALLASTIFHVHLNTLSFVTLSISSVMGVLFVLGKISQRFPSRSALKQITIGDLITAAEQGRLELK